MFRPLTSEFLSVDGHTAFLPEDLAQEAESVLCELGRLGLISAENGFTVFPNFGEKGCVRIVQNGPPFKRSKIAVRKSYRDL